jgi:hypothetical protein
VASFYFHLIDDVFSICLPSNFQDNLCLALEDLGRAQVMLIFSYSKLLCVYQQSSKREPKKKQHHNIEVQYNQQCKVKEKQRYSKVVSSSLWFSIILIPTSLATNHFLNWTCFSVEIPLEMFEINF